MSENFLTIEEFLKLFIAETPPPKSLEETRERQAAYGLASPLPDNWIAQEILLGEIPALELSGPESTNKGALLFFHAGGYSAGTAADHAGLAAHLGKAAQVKSYAVDYRLAPEHRFPAAIEDAFQAYLNLLERLGKQIPIAVAGDSAGGGIAIAIAQLCALRGVRKPVCVYAISPWANMQLDNKSYLVRKNADPMLSSEALQSLRNLYLSKENFNDPRASPVLGSFADFPPMLIDVGANEVLLGDALEIAELTSIAGNTVSLNIWKDMIHIFPWFYPHLKEAENAIKIAGSWVRNYFNP